MAATLTNLLSVLQVFKRYVFGPKLIRIFPAGGGSTGRDFDPSNLEFLSDFFITSVSYAVSLSIYTSPILACYIYKKGMTTAGNLVNFSKIIAAIGASVTFAHIVRGIGRLSNPDYKRFLQVLLEAKHDPAKRARLQQYDFEFFAWPVDFRWDESDVQVAHIQEGSRDGKMSYARKMIDLPYRALLYIAAHGFARPLVYPGSVKLLQNAFAEPLKNGRAYLVEKNGIRAKLLSQDGNEIDTMFLDKRNTELYGSTLVICSEGNAAFYELGCMITPRIAGYSVLGWNHPGFAGSSGLPFPESEKKAIEVVVKYAVTKLGFQFDQIILFGWSIGGFALSYAAMAYPQIKAVIIDATFDNVLPLAKIKMPGFASNFVGRVVDDYFDLNIEKHLVRYPGPIRLIRRFQEEIIATEPFKPATNRVNFLLISILKHRYPEIMTEESVNVVKDFLGAKDFTTQDEVKRTHNFDEEACEKAVEEYFNGAWPLFPCDIGRNWDADFRSQVALFLVSKYMDHFDATHCTPLPSTYFRVPWAHQS